MNHLGTRGDFRSTTSSSRSVSPAMKTGYLLGHYCEKAASKAELGSENPAFVRFSSASLSSLSHCCKWGEGLIIICTQFRQNTQFGAPENPPDSSSETKHSKAPSSVLLKKIRRIRAQKRKTTKDPVRIPPPCPFRSERIKNVRRRRPRFRHQASAGAGAGNHQPLPQTPVPHLPATQRPGNPRRLRRERHGPPPRPRLRRLLPPLHLPPLQARLPRLPLSAPRPDLPQHQTPLPLRPLRRRHRALPPHRLHLRGPPRGRQGRDPGRGAPRLPLVRPGLHGRGDLLGAVLAPHPGLHPRVLQREAAVDAVRVAEGGGREGGRGARVAPAITRRPEPRRGECRLLVFQSLRVLDTRLPPKGVQEVLRESEGLIDASMDARD
ncbi:hypothetical protein H6P81_017154 [Aristolochia fimbriata]|uniref:Uncharacterized protein n=1 Tax=Aristolochia fimbriata TaxID=158543 RepID=A0AAV7DXD0_ARIFI|nr:hypothetical protein H6P81_017154 [Aristolochia fimbriata]